MKEFNLRVSINIVLRIFKLIIYILILLVYDLRVPFQYVGKWFNIHGFQSVFTISQMQI